MSLWKKRECLSVWKEMEGERATYRAFISAAEDAGDQQLAHTVRDLFSHTTGTVERDSDIVEDDNMVFSELETLPVPPTDTRTLPVGTKRTYIMEPLIFNMFVPSLSLYIANPSPSIEAMQEQSNGGIALDTSSYI